MSQGSTRGVTRLVIRQRTAYEPSFGNWLAWRVFSDPIAFVMERKMLLGIKARVDAAVGDGGSLKGA